MPTVSRHAISRVSEGVWRASDFASSAEFTWQVSAAELSELKSFSARMIAEGKRLEEVQSDDFDCPAMAKRLEEIFAELQRGRGMVVLSGFPVEQWSQEEMEYAYWGMGTRLGTAISQSVLGERLGHVIDVTKVERDRNARAYRSSRELNPHTDGGDVVGLFCLRQGKSGGVSLFTNALAVHNELLENAPDVLESLYRGFYFHRHGEQAPHEEEITPAPIPVFSIEDGKVSTIWNKLYMELGQIVHNQGPLSAAQSHAFRRFLEATNNKKLQLRFVLEPGQIIWFNNLTHYHARTEFEDVDDPEQRRHLLRLWLRSPSLRPRSAAMNTYDGSISTGIEKQIGKRPSFDSAAIYQRFGAHPLERPAES